MKKIWFAFLATASATAAICISGYGYIFKAIGINLKKGPLTPSIDDEGKFPSNPVPNANPKAWEKGKIYNTKTLPESVLKDLKKTRTSSLVVIQDGKLVHEQYWKDHNYSSQMNSFSMAKGILSILVGCAIEDGYIENENQLISTIFPQYENSKYGKFLTVRHLMTMQAAMNWEEEYNHPFAPNSKQYFINDLAEQTFGVEVKEMPGKKYEYQSISAQLLGFILKKVTGKDPSTYLSEKLWKPLEMEFPAKWSTDQKGMEKAFCCIHATPRDFAKIGQLLLQNGSWNGKQILSENYLKKLLTPTAENDAFCFTVWANDETEIKHRFLYGFLGQFIITIPEKNMVIVKTGFDPRLAVDKKLRPIQVNFLVEELTKMF